jgi:hypothetical protein
MKRRRLLYGIIYFCVERQKWADSIQIEDDIDTLTRKSIDTEIRDRKGDWMKRMKGRKKHQTK